MTAPRSPADINSVMQAFIPAVQTFCAWLERAHTLTDQDRLRQAREQVARIYHAGTTLPLLADIDRDDAPTTANLERIEFPIPRIGFTAPVDFYHEVFDPYEEDSLVGASLTGDLSEIYSELKLGLLQLQQGASPRDVLWEWTFGFDTHWGDHAVDALRALQRACVRF